MAGIQKLSNKLQNQQRRILHNYNLSRLTKHNEKYQSRLSKIPKLTFRKRNQATT